MSQKEYHTDYKGVDMNISKAAKLSKLEYGNLGFYNLKKRFNMIRVIENKNNIIKFEIYGKIYYYGLVSNKIRRQGSNKWIGKIITNIKNDIDDMFSQIEK